MSMNYEDCDVVEVRWVDSCGFDGSWVDNDELKSLKPKQLTTVGHLVEHCDEHVVVAPTIGDEQNFGSMCIPTCAIRSIETIVGRIDARCVTKMVSGTRAAAFPHIVDAVERGIPVQCRRIGTSEWCDWDMNSTTFLHRGFDWRVKPKESRNE